MNRVAVARRAAASLVAAMGLVTMIQSSAAAHSGGLDSAGCHAGSQPYHCHGGGTGGGGGSDNDDGGGGSSSYDSGPSAAEIAAEAAAAERRQIAAAQTDVYEAKANESKAANELAELERRHAAAKEELNRQREPYETLAEKVDRYNRIAGDHRGDRIQDRKAAALRIAEVKQDNRNARKAHFDAVTGGALAVGFFSGFLLLSLVRQLAAWIVPWRWLWLLGDLIAFIVLIGLSEGSGSLMFGGLGYAGAGVLLSLLFMLPALWWLPFKISTPLTVVLLGISAVIVAAGIAALATESAPVAEQPASSDVAQVQEAQADPTAEEVTEAQKADAAAEKLEPKLKDLTSEVKAAQQQEEELSRLVAKAKSDADAAAQRTATAESNLANLQ